MNSRSRAVGLAVRAVIGLPFAGMAFNSLAAEPDETSSLATVYVSAAAIREDPDNIAASHSVLEGADLFRHVEGTLGDTLSSLPGVRSDTFGGGATRPIIRGQTAPRVKVLSDSASLLDASDISPDHAVTAEPLLIDRIEVLRGPATLLYGSGAVGGVVNVLDDKIPTRRPVDGIDGSVALRAGTVANERAVAAKVSASAGDHLVLHAEGTLRDADDYRVPDWDERRVDGSRAESGSGSLGLSWVGEDGYLGLAYSYRDDDYGLPGHNHEFESCHPHGSTLHCGGHEAGEGEEDHDHDHEEHGNFPVIDLVSKRIDLRGEIENPFAGVEGIRIRASHTDYRHYEIEEGEISTTFRNKGYEGRVELQHAALMGWRGVAGFQLADTEFSVDGEEAFIPTTKSNTLGLFAVEHFELNDAVHFEVGARHEWQKLRPVDDPRNRPRFSDSATSLSAAVVWEVVPDYRLTLSGTRSERLPQAQELYARGIHLATNTYECGLVPHPLTCGGLENNAPLGVETSNNLELSLRRTAGKLTFEAGAYLNKVDNYIYARTLDSFENFRLIKYTQQDAEFRGMEAEVTYQFAESFAATLFGDYVRARFDAGGNLPRIPAARLGARLNAQMGVVDGELEYYHIDDQRDIADYESVTPGYDMVNLAVTYPAGEQGRYKVFARASNLLDEQVFNHSSFLADVVPMPGRNLSVGVRLTF
jgi:iron complex outermembrane recepter protein